MDHLTARDLASAPVITISPDASLGEAAAMLLEHNVSCLPVVSEDGGLVGIITHTDFVPRQRHLPFSEENFYSLLGDWVSAESLEQEYGKLAAHKVGEVMSRPVITVEEDTPLPVIARTMLEKKLSRLPVVQEGRMVGIITRHDLVKIVTRGMAGHDGPARR